MKIDDEYIVTELETLKVIGAPLRVQILEFVGMACESGRLPTVKQIADALELPANKLYYHVNLLEKHDLIRVAETRVVSGIIEKHYQIRAKRLLVDLNVVGTDDYSRDEKMELTLASVRSMFDNAYQNIEKSFRHRYKNNPEELPEDKKNPMHYGQSLLQLSSTQGKEIVAEMNALTKKYEDLNTAGGITFGLTVAFNPNYHLSTTQTEDAK